MNNQCLGVLQLENEPLNFRGTLGSPETFDFSVKRVTVPGAWAQNVIDGDASVEQAYVDCARQLEREGVTAITANCGFAVRYQAAVAAAVSVPVALSSLLQVPFVASTLPEGRKVGILTFDSRKLVEHHFADAGWSTADVGVAVAGIEGSETWHQGTKPTPAITADMLTSDVMAAATSLVTRDPSVGALVFECTAFPAAAETVRRATGLLVVDNVNMANMLVGAAPFTP